jgi:hypothetical protein
MGYTKCGAREDCHENADVIVDGRPMCNYHYGLYSERKEKTFLEKLAHEGVVVNP